MLISLWGLDFWAFLSTLQQTEYLNNILREKFVKKQGFLEKIREDIDDVMFADEFCNV